MNNWIPKNRIMEFAIAAVSLSAALYFVGLFIVWDGIKKVENLYQNTESESFREDKSWAIKSIIEANKEPIQILRSFFIQRGDEVEFIEKIEETARTSAIKFEISSIDVKPDEEDPFKEDINIKMAVDGSWKNIMRFVDSLEKTTFGVLVESVNLDAKVSGHWAGSIEFIVFREK